ncbi:hypothetical protein [Lacrimispora sp. 38-1]|uniref:hypothetical protein n=1 Tax=Lacrimispora sp. 38-1 TaxID=3125778 RepID=UPI003CF25C01
MGQYNKAILTAAGENLIAQALAGEIQLNITKAKTSNYIYPVGTDFKSLTDMQGIKQTVSDPVTTVYNDTMIQTRALFSNEEIASTYYIHDIGLYTMDGTEEVLFCIVTAETPDEMPQYNGVASTSYIYNIQNVVQDATELHIVVNPSGTATIQDVLERVDATGGDISETVIETLETIEDKYPVPAAGENVKRFFGKVLTFIKNIRPLTSDITLYVSADTGSDITGDGSQLKPFKTIQHAIDIVPKNLNGYVATVNVAAGTYDENVLIPGFYGGSFNLYSDTKDTLTGTCYVKSITVSKCGHGYFRLNGFNLTATDREAIMVNGSYNVHLQYCQSIVNVPSYTGIQCNESFCSTGNCKIANRNHAISFSNCRGVSAYWNAGSTGNVFGISTYNGSVVHMIGTQPTGTTLRAQGSGGSFSYENGTQIQYITSGLSCTWGTIAGGYIRHGNSSGTAMVTINIQVTLTSQLSAGILYSILGFPPAQFISVPVNCQALDHFNYYILTTGGQLQLKAQVTLQIGNVYQFSVTYLTNS